MVVHAAGEEGVECTIGAQYKVVGPAIHSDLACIAEVEEILLVVDVWLVRSLSRNEDLSARERLVVPGAVELECGSNHGAGVALGDGGGVVGRI